MRLLKRYLKLLPTRFKRLWEIEVPTKWYDWPIDFAFKIFDLFGIPELFEFGLNLFKSNYRMLNAKESALILEFYSGLLDTDQIRVNDSINKLTSRSAQAFVTFNTINFKGSISNAVFVHELMHIYQFQKYGSMYIYRALKAQN